MPRQFISPPRSRSRPSPCGRNGRGDTCPRPSPAAARSVRATPRAPHRPRRIPAATRRCDRRPRRNGRRGNSLFTGSAASVIQASVPVSPDDTSFGLSISKPGRQIVGDDDAAVLRLRLGHFQHDDEALVLRGLGRIGRFAVQRVNSRSILKPRSAAGSGVIGAPETDHHRLHIALALVGDGKRRRQLIGAQAAVVRTLARLAADAERDGVELLGERARGEHQPGILLCRGRRRQRAGGVDAQHGLVDGRLRRAAFGGQRHQRRGIAQRRAEIGAAEIELRLRCECIECPPDRPGPSAPCRRACRARQRSAPCRSASRCRRA